MLIRKSGGNGYIRWQCWWLQWGLSFLFETPASVFLRAADAIHLATAAESGFRIVYSNDVHLLNAAKHFEIEGRDVIDPGA